MIEQHIYAKTGIGLETYKKSAGVSERFIDSYIRPNYSSLELFYLEGKDSRGYKSMIPLIDGSFLIGSGIKGNSGAGSLIHNYIVPKDEKDIFENAENLLCEPEQSVAAVSLSALDKLPEKDEKKQYEELLKGSKITKSEYIALLTAVFAAAEQNRNVFISLPKAAGIMEIKALIYGIYANLPYYLRRKVGFTTLFGETEIKSGINIYFIQEEKIIKSKDSCFIENYNASRDFVFDFNKRTHFHITDLKEDMDGEYISFVTEALETGESLSDFFAFAKEAEKNTPHEKKISLRFYNDLAFIYNLSKSEETLPPKIGRITFIFTDLLRGGKKDRILMSYSAFLKMYRRYIKGNGLLIPLEILKRLVNNYDFCPDSNKDESYDLINLDIDLCLKDSESEILFMHIDALKGSSALYNKIIEHKMIPSNRLIKKYFTYLIERKNTIHSLMEFVESICLEMPKLTENETIEEIILGRAFLLYDTSGDRLEAVWYLDNKCDYLIEKFPKGKKLFAQVYKYALHNYMKDLNISDLNLRMIEKFPLTDAESINDECTIKHKIILATKEIMALTKDVAMSFVHYDAFGFGNIRANLSEDEDEAKTAEDEVKKLLISCLKEKKDAPKLIQCIILFYIFEAKDMRMKHDFDKIFEYIEGEMGVSCFEFMRWYLSSNLFVEPKVKNGKIIREVLGERAELSALTAFYEGVRKYFLRHKELLKNDREMKKLKKEMDALGLIHQDFKDLTSEFKKILSGMMRENYSPVKRVADRIASFKNFKFTVISIGVTLGIIALILTGSLISKNLRGNTLERGEVDKNQIAMANRTGWSAYILKLDGEYVPVKNIIDGKESEDVVDFKYDDSICVSVSDNDGILIDGISISAKITDESEGILVYVVDEKGKKTGVGISDYDTESGASLYTFPESMYVKEIIIEKKGSISQGKVYIKEVNAYIKK